MAKAKRGKNIKASGWRGTCPICKRTGVKLLWDVKTEEGKEVKVCKVCGK
jgi:transcription elongation factor Elf1